MLFNMKEKNNKYDSKRDFSLIELLVIIAVIAILLSLLLPSLKKARHKALSAVCQSNLSNIGKGVMMFSKNNSGFMPTNNIGNSSGFTPGLVYYTSKYLGVEVDTNNPLNTDLSDTVFHEPVLNGFISHPVAAGYGWNWRYMGYKQSKHAQVYWPRRLESIYEPSHKMLAADTSDTKYLGGNVYFRYQNVGNRHNNRINALHGDGHTESVNSAPLRTNNNDKWWYGDSAH